MVEITIYTSKCSSKEEVYKSLLDQLGAPKWHGKNLDALWDSISSDDINAVKAPCRVHFKEMAKASSEINSLVYKISQLITEAKLEGVKVGYTVEQ